MSYYSEKNYVETPSTTIDDFYNEEKVIIVHSHINAKGKMILNKAEAALLMLELHKFITSE
jgi:hypothetical protein